MIGGHTEWSAPLWRSSPRGIDLLGLFLPNPTHALWGDAMRARLIAWRGDGDAIPEAVGSMSLVARLIDGVKTHPMPSPSSTCAGMIRVR